MNPAAEPRRHSRTLAQAELLASGAVSKFRRFATGDNTETVGDVRGCWFIAAAATLFVLFTIGVAGSLATGWPSPAKATRQAVRRTPVQSPCAKVLVRDWADGRIDGAYPLACYRVALKSLPVDLQVYSSASEDISQALSQRIVQRAKQRSTSTGTRYPAG